MMAARALSARARAVSRRARARRRRDGRARDARVRVAGGAAAAGRTRVTVRVTHSTINYKDAMILQGRPGLVPAWPIVPGIDAAGVVVASDDPAWREGDAAVITGNKIGQHFDGGYATLLRVQAGWLVRPPAGLDAAACMAIGSAGFTAMQCVDHLERRARSRAAGRGRGRPGAVGARARPARPARLAPSPSLPRARRRVANPSRILGARAGARDGRGGGLGSMAIDPREARIPRRRVDGTARRAGGGRARSARPTRSAGSSTTRRGRRQAAVGGRRRRGRRRRARARISETKYRGAVASTGAWPAASST